MSTGKLYIISAPSGAGKTSLVRQLITEVDGLIVSISHTTRPIRPGEIHGEDYYFVSPIEFQSLLNKRALLEHASVFDNFYGTAKTTVETSLNKGLDVILEIDWQGAQQIKNIRPDSLSIFILPPSTEILEQRLQNRGQDDDHVIARRMRDAVTEMSHYEEFDYILVNDAFERALTELKSIIIANRLTKDRQQHNLKQLISALLSSPESS
ncbi:MAG: guanylate kinase [Methyloglobulus sp.]|nr:guanylate kinase [Methyloglobulus sp.]